MGANSDLFENRVNSGKSIFFTGVIVMLFLFCQAFNVRHSKSGVVSHGSFTKMG